MNHNKCKVVVTGASGYLGGRIAEYFANNSEFGGCIAASRRKLDIQGNIEYRFLDMTDKNTIEGILAGAYSCVHLAALNEVACVQEPELAHIVNVESVRELAKEAVKQKLSSFIYISTAHVYGNMSGTLSENDQASPQNIYARTHKDAEDIIEEICIPAGIKTYSLRLSNVIGAPATGDIDRWTLIANDLCRQAVVNHRLKINTHGLQCRDFVAMSDIIDAVFLFVKGKDIASGIYNVGSGQSISIAEIAGMIAKIASVLLNKEIVIDKKMPLQQELSQNWKLVYSIEKILNVGFVPKQALSREIEETIKFLCEHDSYRSTW